MNTKHIVAIGVIVSIAALAGHRQALAQVQAVPTGFMNRGSAQGLLVPGQSIWPKPGDMVTIDSWNLAPVGSRVVDLPVGQLVDIFSVPADKAFVVTHIQHRAFYDTSLVEDNVGVVTVKRLLPATSPNFDLVTRDYGYPMGVVFAPGSTVSLSNALNTQGAFVELNITGYLAAP